MKAELFSFFLSNLGYSRADQAGGRESEASPAARKGSRRQTRRTRKEAQRCRSKEANPFEKGEQKKTEVEEEKRERK